METTGGSSSGQRPSGAAKWVFATLAVIAGAAAIVALGLTSGGMQFHNFVNSQNHYADAPHSRLAELVLTSDLAPEVTEEHLERIIEAVMSRADEGHPDAAAFVFALAQRQRELKEAEMPRAKQGD